MRASQAAGYHDSAVLRSRPYTSVKVAPPVTTPGNFPAGPPSTGRLQLSTGGLLLVPDSYDPSQPSPFILMLHGACAKGADCAHVFNTRELELGRVIVCLPNSQGRTWDMIRMGYGPDVANIDRTIDQVFREYTIDPMKMACAGFSDGASYALGLGLHNASSAATDVHGAAHSKQGLFTHIMALSPGFMRAPNVLSHVPKIYISHGSRDEVLNINYCSHRIVSQLAKMGVPSDLLKFHEFNGTHVIPPSIATEALQWFLND